MTQIKKLANKARQFNKCVKKAEGHLKRLGDENDKERYKHKTLTVSNPQTTSLYHSIC